MSMAPEERRLTTASGIALNALVWPGSIARGAVLLIHGLASNCRTWVPVGGRIHRDAGFAVAAVDLRGHGLSDKPASGYEFSTMRDDVLSAMAALGYERPLIAGQSTGGNLALELAIQSPDRVSAVVGVDGGTIELQDRWPLWSDCARDLAPPILAGQSASSIRSLIVGSHPSWTDEALDATLANFEVLADGTVRPWLTRERHMQVLRALWENQPSKALPELTVRLDLLFADGGGAWADAKHADARTAEAYGARVRWYEGADHDLHLDRSDEVAAAIVSAARQAALSAPASRSTLDRR